jgi:uncharacterized protein (DUF488 family)
MKLFTIGFTKKTANVFFSLLQKNEVKKIIDIRLNNKSQLAGFTKEDDFRFFLKTIAGIEYIHLTKFAPNEELLKKYQKKEIDWKGYEIEYLKLLDTRKVTESFDTKILENACLLCSEEKADNCHRRLLAEYLKKEYPEIEIIHL